MIIRFATERGYWKHGISDSSVLFENYSRLREHYGPATAPGVFEWFAHETIGFSVGHTAGIARVDFS